jgi:hypothetical protein
VHPVGLRAVVRRPFALTRHSVARIGLAIATRGRIVSLLSSVIAPLRCCVSLVT